MKIELPTEVEMMIVKFIAPCRIDVVRKFHLIRELNEKRVAVQNICWRSVTDLEKGYVATPGIMKLILDWGMNELRTPVHYDVSEEVREFEKKWVATRLNVQRVIVSELPQPTF
jgi:hypothetical protein